MTNIPISFSKIKIFTLKFDLFAFEVNFIEDFSRQKVEFTVQAVIINVWGLRSSNLKPADSY